MKGGPNDRRQWLGAALRELRYCFTSVGWGRIATVMVLVWMRPCFSVLGTLCTLCTPPSNFMCL